MVTKNRRKLPYGTPSNHHGGRCTPLFMANFARNASVFIQGIKINWSPSSVKYCRANFAPDAFADPAVHGGARRRQFLARHSRNINIKHVVILTYVIIDNLWRLWPCAAFERLLDGLFRQIQVRVVETTPGSGPTASGFPM